jgi:Ala-tRNA(Pro) deacylase
MTAAGTTAFLQELDADEVPYELIRHKRTETAAAEARELGVPTTHVAKTLVLETPVGFVRAVLPASARLDMRKVRGVLGEKEVRLASEATMAGAYPEFELGAVPPVGGPPDRVLVDRGLLAGGSIVLEAGSHEGSVRIQIADLVARVHAEVADLCED